MLDVERCHMIQALHKKGLSISDIARCSGHDCRTGRKVIAGPLLPMRMQRALTLDPYADHLRQRLDAGMWNAHKLYAEIKAHAHTGSETRVRAWIHPLREVRLRLDPLSSARYSGSAGQTSAWPIEGAGDPDREL
jgi:hypothetical protein